MSSLFLPFIALLFFAHGSLGDLYALTDLADCFPGDSHGVALLNLTDPKEPTLLNPFSTSFLCDSGMGTLSASINALYTIGPQMGAHRGSFLEVTRFNIMSDSPGLQNNSATFVSALTTHSTDDSGGLICASDDDNHTYVIGMQGPLSKGMTSIPSFASSFLNLLSHFPETSLLLSRFKWYRPGL